MKKSSNPDFIAYQIDGLNSEITLNLRGVSQSSESSTFNISVDDLPVGSFEIDEVPDGPGTLYSIKARQEDGLFILPNEVNFELEVLFDGNAAGERGYIDFFHMTFTRSLRLYNNETDFRWNANEGELIRYEVSNAADATIWNVTDPTEVTAQEFSLSGGQAIFQSQSGEIEEFVVFSGNEFPTPFIYGGVANQNIRGSVNFDGIIVTNQAFLQAAEQLAQFHRDHDGLNIQVSTTQEVYNEFSSGRQDVTAIRDYAKHVYDAGGRLKYLLLFGDCSYDYKDRINNNTNYVPTYESRQSFHPIMPIFKRVLKYDSYMLVFQHQSHPCKH